jgi:hypothetical protein
MRKIVGAEDSGFALSAFKADEANSHGRPYGQFAH